MLYQLARAGLFALDAERAHELTLASFRHAPQLAGLFSPCQVALPVTAMGLEFPNPVGLAAGLDKNGECISAFSRMGFGYIEVGTVTPRAQPGNPRPRLFRLPREEALINRLGFNNHGVDVLVKNVETSGYEGILGINIGKNFDTPIERAADDYLHCLRRVYPHASYVTVNISSPNTARLRELQGGEALAELLAVLKAEQARLADQHGRQVPLVVKIAPDLSDQEIGDIAALLMRHELDGVIATNTTVDRTAVSGCRHSDEQGGLSGRPLQSRSDAVVRKLAGHLSGALPIIGVGGIHSGESARQKAEAGATLLQIYTGFIYQGPALIRDAVNALASR